ncbi:MAG: glycosyltransferase family 2 protein [Armatimonadetes bacterium]|nr:glycosyltransferase family 2 protein [Armatimonadota bacterium]
MPIPDKTISVCICTMDRPDVLRRCLNSIIKAAGLPWEIIVSDDSGQPEATDALCRSFAPVKYVRGPRAGLCANRNAAISACSGTYVSLLDDDALLSENFIDTAGRLIAQSDPRTIFTGDVVEGGRIIQPRNPSFWGHFNRQACGRHETINLNSNLFPRSAFDLAAFDEAITYGCEDMDICSRLLAAGYRIEYRPELVNQHIPPPKSAALLDRQRQQSEQARFYTSLKRYLLWQKKPLKALAYVILAPLHLTAHHLRRGRFDQALLTFRDMRRAVELVKASRTVLMPRRISYGD